MTNEPGQPGFYTILFSDIEGFTPLTERLGDFQSLRVLRRHNRILREAIHRHGGIEMRCAGDGFMVVFASPWSAVRCAVHTQSRLADPWTWEPDEAVRVRIGIHTGRAVRDGDDLHGRDVIVAARVAARARGGEILVSSSVRNLVAGLDDVVLEDGHDAALKGLSGTYRLYRLRYPARAPGRLSLAATAAAEPRAC